MKWTIEQPQSSYISNSRPSSPVEQLNQLREAVIRLFPIRDALTARQHADYYERALLVALARARQVSPAGRPLAELLTDVRVCFSAGGETSSRRRFYYLGNGQRIFDDMRQAAEVMAGFHGDKVPDWLTHIEITVRLETAELMAAFCSIFNSTVAFVLPSTPSVVAKVQRWPYARPAGMTSADAVTCLASGANAWAEWVQMTQRFQ